MDFSSPKTMGLMIILLLLITVVPFLIIFFEFALANWLILILVALGLITFILFSKYLLKKGGSGAGQAFRGVP